MQCFRLASLVIASHRFEQRNRRVNCVALRAIAIVRVRVCVRVGVLFVISCASAVRAAIAHEALEN